MEKRIITATQQLCFRSLCGVCDELRAPAGRNRVLILKAVIAGMRRSRRRQGCCANCPYQGACANPDEASLLATRACERTRERPPETVS